MPWLVVGGALGVGWLIAGTQNDTNLVRQNVYGTQQDCEQDYRTDQCVRTFQSGAYGGHFMYFGPVYYTRDAPQGDPGPGRTALSSSDGRSTTANSVSEARVSRGGFGGTARSGRGGYYGG
ncbi:hypothetical protein [Terricaulis sp.]|uniref:hypothetical protein n=1 Tax=Terricaulis sp. TaxID=2768686 RepID=UPI003784BDB9